MAKLSPQETDRRKAEKAYLKSVNAQHKRQERARISAEKARQRAELKAEKTRQRAEERAKQRGIKTFWKQQAQIRKQQEKQRKIAEKKRSERGTVGGFITGGVGTKKEQARRAKANVRTTKRIMKKVKKRLFW